MDAGYTHDGRYDTASASRYINSAIAALRKAVEIEPEDQEGNYFLAHAYDRLYSGFSPGEHIPLVSLEQTRTISNYLERVISVSPYYDGEVAILGPQMKLTSMWGVLAAAYAVRGLPDSARWALREGSRAGGFRAQSLELCRNILKSCKPNAIVLVNGDGDTFPMWYLQGVEGYRADITIVNLSLLNAEWYPKWLKSSNSFGAPLPELGYSDQDIDALSYRRIEGSEEYRLPAPDDVLRAYGIDASERQGVEGETVRVMAPGNEGVFMIQDQMFVNMLQTNAWRRPVYFSCTVEFDVILAVGVERHLEMAGAAMQVYPVPIEKEKMALDVPFMEKLLLSDGDDGFSWDSWRAPRERYEQQDLADVGPYFLTMALLADHYLATKAGTEPVTRVLGRMRKVFPEEHFAELYNVYYKALEETYGVRVEDL